MMTGHWLTRTTRFFILNVMLTALVACGGGGGGSDGGGFLGGAEDPIFTLSIQSFDSSGSSTPQFSIDQPLRVVVSLRTNGDGAISGQRVELSTTVGTITPSNGSALTNAEGDAEFTIAAGDVSGAGVLTATYAASTGAITATQDIEVVAEESVFVLDLQTVNAAGASVRQFSTNNPLTIRAILYTVRAGVLSPVSNVALSAASSIGTISPDNGSTLSDGEGLAEFQLTGGETTGAGRVTVSYQNADGVTLASRSVNVEAVSAGSGYTMELQTSDVDGNTTREFSSEAPLLVRATVTPEVAGASREGLLVTLASTVGSVSPEAGAALTNAQGVATFLLTADGVVGAGTATATLSIEGATITTATTVESQAIQDNRRLVVRGLDANGQPAFTFSEGMPLTVRVAIEDPLGNIQDIDGATINLASSIGSVSPSNGSALTTDGTASFVISYDQIVGAGVVTAEYVTDDGVLRGSLNVETTATESFVLNLAAAGGNENGQLGPNDPIDVTVSLSEAGVDGEPVAGALLQLETAIATVTPANGARTTNAAGEAVFTLNYADVEGAGPVTVSYTSPAGDVFSNTINIEAARSAAPPIIQIEFTETPDGVSTTSYSARAPLSIGVLVTEADGVTPRVGESVLLGSTIGRVSPDNGLAITDDNGLARFTLSYNGETGAGVVSASLPDFDASGVSQSSVQSIAVDTAYELTLISVSNNGVITRDTPVTLNFQLVAVDANLSVANQVISLTSTLGTVSPGNGSTRTDADGIASFTLSYDDVLGAGTATATYATEDGAITAFASVEAVSPAVSNSLQITTFNAAGNPSRQVSAESTMTVNVTLVDPSGATVPLTGELIQLSSTIGNVTPANGTALLLDGVATFNVAYDGNVGAGELTATYDVGAAVLRASRGIESVVANPYSVSLVSSGGALSVNNPLAVTVQVLDSAGQAVTPAPVVEVTSTIGVLDRSSGLVDADGNAVFNLSYDRAGAGVVTATVVSDEGTFSNTVNIDAQEEALNTYQLSVEKVTAGDLTVNNPLTLEVTLLDASGAAVVGEVVELSTTVGALGQSTVLTDGSGKAQLTLSYTGAGAGTVSASYTAAEGTFTGGANIRAVGEALNTYQLSVEKVTAGDLTVNNPLTLEVTLLDASGAAVVGEVVELSTTVGALGQSTVLTDGSGKAQLTLSYTGAGAGTVSASYTAAEGTFTGGANIRAVEEAPNYVVNIVSIEGPDDLATTDFSSSEPLTVVVGLQEAGAIPTGVRPVTLTLAGVPGEILPANGVALTDPVTGQATFLVNYGGQTGAGELTATYAGPVGEVTDSRLVEAVVADLDVGSFDDSGTYTDAVIRALPSTDVSYLGSVELLLAVVDVDLNPVTSAETVRFESPCLINGFSTLDTGLTTTTSNGVVSVTYTAGENCEDRSEVITATLEQPGRTLVESATTTLGIGAAPAANERFMTFVAAEPINMALRGTGGGSTLEERSQVTFEVRDGAGNPVAGQRVDFALSATTGGIELADVSGTTDANGQVRATVFAGVIATPVRVIASTERRPAADADTDPANDADAVTVVSDQLSISSGIVTQARFSIAASVLNVPGAAVVNGVTTDITASAFDRFGNPVPDGTTVNFTSECGGIGGAGPTGACQTTAGFCTVTWFSQPGSLTVCPDNRVTIMAHAQGEEAFTDVDANGFYSTDLDGPAFANEPFVDNQEAWRDDNESGDYNTPELFIDVDTGAGDTPPLNGEHDDRTPPAPAVAALFNGLACLDETETYCKKALVSVFDTLELIAGTDDAAALTAGLYTTGGALLDPGADPVTAGTYILRLSDDTGATVNFPPFGTTVSTATGGECEVVSPGLSVGNSSAETFFQFPVTIRTETDDPTTDDFVEITWAIPGGNGNQAQLVFNCNP